MVVVRVLEVRWVDRPRCAPSLTAVVRNSAPLPGLGAWHPCSATVLRCLAPLLRYQAVWSPPIFTACVCDLCRVRVLVRLSHPRPPDRSQHGCTVGVLPGPTRVLPMPRQCGIGRRAPTRAVLSCAALWCLVVRRPRRRVDCLVLTFIGIPLTTPPRHGYGCGPVDLRESHTTCGSSYSLSRLISDCECCNCFC